MNTTDCDKPGVLPTLKRLSGGTSELITFRVLRSACSHISAEDFNRKVVALARDGNLSLHRHDYWWWESPAERSSMLQLGTDEHGRPVHYIGASLRHPAR
jgi:hypothetical protein